jgi:light-regulated signal transduction histidine kinase (bacteriophytochrome)
LLAGTVNALNVTAAVAPDAETLLKSLSEGVGCAILAEEALSQAVIDDLQPYLQGQPPWSDLPLIVLTSSGVPTRQSREKAQQFQTLGNVSLLERPVRPDTIQSAVRSSLRARLRQYEVRSRQEALARANADLEQFAHSASHDLREPLRSIGVYSDLLQQKYVESLDERGLEFLGQIRTNTKRMAQLLDDLLNYAHASSIPDESLEPIHAIKSLEAALENLAGAIRENSATVTATSDLPSVRIRESHLSQVFQNLIGNAIKYRKDTDPPVVQLSAARAGTDWVFSIADNGIGVPPAYKEKIFGLFQRLHTNTKYAGSGMGLAICQRIVERYHGRIWVESELGRGANFFFTIPG